MLRIGILEMATPDKERLGYWRFFLDSLQKQELTEGQDFTIDYRWAHGHQDRLAGEAVDLVNARVDVIVTAGTPAAAAAIRATSDIPIVMATGVSLGTQLSDADAPVTRNVTGISDLPRGVSERRLLILREALGDKASLGFLADRSNPSSPLALRETYEAAKAHGLTVKEYWLEGPDQIDQTLAAMRADGVHGFVVAPGAMFFAKRAALASAAIKHGLGAMAVRREYVEAGCLIAYGAPLLENYRQAATLVSKVLRGTHPGDLPVAEPETFDFVINIDTAKQLGIEIPPDVMRRAEKIGGG